MLQDMFVKKMKWGIKVTVWLKVGEGGSIIKTGVMKGGEV